MVWLVLPYSGHIRIVILPCGHVALGLEWLTSSVQHRINQTLNLAARCGACALEAKLG